MLEKRPRHYAAEIMEFPTRKQRADALDKVPAEWREMVKKHVEIMFNLKKGKSNGSTKRV